MSEPAEEFIPVGRPLAGHRLAPYVAVALGAIAGAYLRVGLSLLPGTGSAGDWPWITFAVNLAGTLVLAYAVSLLLARARSTSLLRPLIGTGFCGALTTFATLQLEVFRMLRAGHGTLAIGYLTGSVVAGYAMVLLGVALGRRSAAA